VRQLHHQKPEPAILAVSVGNSHFKDRSYKKVYLKKWLGTIFSSPIESDDSERVHRGMEHLQRGAKTSYHRFNIGASMRTFHDKFDRIRQRYMKNALYRIEKLTSKYLKEPRIEEQLSRLAKVLVQQRRIPISTKHVSPEMSNESVLTHSSDQINAQ